MENNDIVNTVGAYPLVTSHELNHAILYSGDTVGNHLERYPLAGAGNNWQINNTQYTSAGNFQDPRIDAMRREIDELRNQLVRKIADDIIKPASKHEEDPEPKFRKMKVKKA